MYIFTIDGVLKTDKTLPLTNSSLKCPNIKIHKKKLYDVHGIFSRLTKSKNFFQRPIVKLYLRVGLYSNFFLNRALVRR